ncbi:MAG: 1-deoxy-D-xylulose-5-phosphate synthase N-terminal domain-containing protein, partial [Halanaerobiaceae bacterium]
MKKIDLLQDKAVEIRKKLLKMIFKSGTGHTGGSLSSTDILTVLYYEILNIDSKNPEKENRDRFILSKGHSIEAYYCILADLGFIREKELDTFCQYKTRLIGHPSNKVPGIEMNTGALGHGLSVAAGMAKAAKMDDKLYKVYTLMGD